MQRGSIMIKENLKSEKFMKLSVLFGVLIFSLFGVKLDFAEASSKVFQLASAANSKITQHENKTLDLLSRIDAFNEKDDRLRSDAAKAHYNMGNIYYQKGEYEIAAREYYQAVTLMPNDPDSHYNLAYVSSEELHDFNTAIKHYRMYLYLSPNAKDKNVVNEKIVQAKIAIRGRISSPLEDCLEYGTEC